LTAHRNGFGFFVGLWTKAFNRDNRHLLFGEVLDLFHKAFFIQ
jgi:hypothetical protein